MYSERGIEKLSESQLHKLLRGHPVRVKAGHHHKIHLSQEQHKALDRAMAKNKSKTITLDPYQMELHRQMHAQGLFGDLFKAGVKAIAPHALHGLADLGNNLLQEKLGSGKRRVGRPRKVGRPKGSGEGLMPAGYGAKSHAHAHTNMKERMAHVRAGKKHTKLPKGHHGKGVAADVLKSLVGLLPF